MVRPIAGFGNYIKPGILKHLFEVKANNWLVIGYDNSKLRAGLCVRQYNSPNLVFNTACVGIMAPTSSVKNICTYFIL